MQSSGLLAVQCAVPVICFVCKILPGRLPLLRGKARSRPTGPVFDWLQAHGAQLNFSATLPVGELVTKEFDFLHVTPPMSAPDFIRS